MRAVSTEQMRELDRRTIAGGVPGAVLMERAGRGVARAVLQLRRESRRTYGPVILFAGTGNNGGDAFVTARLLREKGVRAELWLAGARERVSGDARHHLERALAAQVALHELPTEEAVTAADIVDLEPGIVVDGVLGTGVHGPARGVAAAAIRRINELGERNLVVAIDLPSGLDSDTGDAPGQAVRADVTVTMALPKRGLLTPAALDYVGVVEVVDIGLPATLTDSLTAELELIAAADLRPLVPRRPRASHKGTFGHALVIAGAPGFAGAAALAAGGALRAGAGLVSVLTPAAVAPIVAGIVPEAMVHPGAEAAGGGLAADAVRQWKRGLKDFNSLLIGPGLGAREETRALLEFALRESQAAVVLDADALNSLGPRLDVLRGRPAPVILTPHPGEMARLLGCSTKEVQADRAGAARRAADASGAVVVLKGAGTLVAASGQPLQLNLTGNAGLGTGGTGDVLGGILAGLLAQGLSPYDAARLGIYLHGRAGDRAALRGSQAGLIAGDVIAELPRVWREIVAR